MKDMLGTEVKVGDEVVYFHQDDGLLDISEIKTILLSEEDGEDLAVIKGHAYYPDEICYITTTKDLNI